MRFTINKAMQTVGMSRHKKGFAVVKNTKTGQTAYSKSPKATGIVSKFKMGATPGGHEIHSHSHKDNHKGWNQHDHMAAWRAHTTHAHELADDSSTHPKLIEHHRKAADHHYKQAYPNYMKKSFQDINFLYKAYKNHVIGRTRSGKKVHSHHHHKGHQKYSKRDHEDAMHVHVKRTNRIMKKLQRSKHGTKMHSALRRLLAHHTEHGHAHHHKTTRKKRRVH